MKFKIDENLPVEFAQFLRIHGYDAETVEEENPNCNFYADVGLRDHAIAIAP